MNLLKNSLIFGLIISLGWIAQAVFSKEKTLEEAQLQYFQQHGTYLQIIDGSPHKEVGTVFDKLGITVDSRTRIDVITHPDGTKSFWDVTPLPPLPTATSTL